MKPPKTVITLDTPRRLPGQVTTSDATERPPANILTFPPSPLLDPPATGAYLGGTESPISVLTLASWRVKSFGPPWVAVGRLIRYRQSDLDAWLKSRNRQST